MIIIMSETRMMPFGVFAANETYDTDMVADLTVGQAKTFVLCGAAQEVIPSGETKLKKTAKKVSVDEFTDTVRQFHNEG